MKEIMQLCAAKFQIKKYILNEPNLPFDFVPVVPFRGYKDL